MHYSILVTGTDIEAQMAPFSENLEVAPYKERISETEVDKAVEFLRDRRWESWDNPVKLDTAKQFERERAEAEAVGFDRALCLKLYNGEDVFKDEEGFYRLSTYNPNSQWDYWRIEGRYTRRLLLKPGASGYSEPLSWEWTADFVSDKSEPPPGVDQARKGDVDFERMGDERVQPALEALAKYAEISSELGPVPEWPADRGAVVSSFWQHPVVLAMKEADLLGMMAPFEVHHLWNDEQAFITLERNAGTFPFYGYVRDGQWIERGYDGDRDAYYGTALEWLKSLPDNTLLTGLDIHI